MRLIANMVARNETSRYLVPVLERLQNQVDIVVFTDDASDDDTAEVAHKCGANVFKHDLPLFTTDEGKLRAMSWDHLQQFAEPGDWILAIDADEMLYENKPGRLYEIMSQTDFDVIDIAFCHMWNETQYRVDKAWKPHGSSRMFRFFPGGKFKERQLACGSEPTYVQNLIRANRYMRDSGLMMQHLGYVRDEDKKAKYDRYMKIDGGDFHAKKHIESIMDPEPTLVDWNVGKAYNG